MNELCGCVAPVYTKRHCLKDLCITLRTKTRSNVKYGEVETHQTRQCFLSFLFSNVVELCVNWRSQRPVLGWQERWPSVAQCCCSQWLDHLIMMFVLMSSCTDVPEKKKTTIWWACLFCLRCIFLTNVLWQSGDGIVKLLTNCVKSNHLLLLNPVCSRPWKQSRRDWKE